MMAWIFGILGGITCAIWLLIVYSLMKVCHECSELEKRRALNNSFKEEENR